jgi:hypothetical protein
MTTQLYGWALPNVITSGNYTTDGGRYWGVRHTNSVCQAYIL